MLRPTVTKEGGRSSTTFPGTDLTSGHTLPFCAVECSNLSLSMSLSQSCPRNVFSSCDSSFRPGHPPHAPIKMLASGFSAIVERIRLACTTTLFRCCRLAGQSSTYRSKPHWTQVSGFTMFPTTLFGVLECGERAVTFHHRDRASTSFPARTPGNPLGPNLLESPASGIRASPTIQ